VGYATTMMKKTGRAMRLDTNHRSKIVTLSKGTSASALTGKVCPDLQKQKPKSRTADVVRDVEISRFHSPTRRVGFERKGLFTTVSECSHAAVSKVTEILAFCVS
jgi:hypothetical protein